MPTWDEAKVGERYRVVFWDCCVGGEFEATLVEVDGPDGETGPGAGWYVERAVFDNGVVFDRCGHVDLRSPETVR